MQSSFHLDLDQGRMLGIYFPYHALSRVLADTIGPFDGGQLARALEDEWRSYLQFENKTIWRQTKDQNGWESCVAQQKRLQDILRHVTHFGVLLSLPPGRYFTTDQPNLFLEFFRNRERIGGPQFSYRCEFSIRNEDAQPIRGRAPTLERRFSEIVNEETFPDGSPLTDDPGIVWRALAHVARNLKNSHVINQLAQRLHSGATNCVGGEFTIDTGLVLKDEIPEADAGKNDPIYLSFSKTEKPYFLFGYDGGAKVDCADCLPLLEQYAFIPPAQLAELARVAEEEDWTFMKEDGTPVPYGRLRYYLNATFEKIFLDHRSEADKHAPEIVSTSNGEAEVFCTGLRHRISGLYVYAYCTDRNPGTNTFMKVEWVSKSRDKSGNYLPHPLLDALPPLRSKKNYGLPYPANWTEFPDRLVIPYCDFSIKNLHIAYPHILKNRRRLEHAGVVDILKKRYPTDSPDSLEQSLEKSINDAWQRTRKLLASNYKVAVPVWYKRSISILLPLFLDETNPTVPTIALVVVKKANSKTQKAPEYFAPTCLTLEMARRNARVIARVDDTWLAHASLKSLPRQIEEEISVERNHDRKTLLLAVEEALEKLNQFDAELEKQSDFGADSRGSNTSSPPTLGTLGTLSMLLPDFNGFA